MRFIVNNEKKIIIGWSPKCGCSHIKNLYSYLMNNESLKIKHSSDDLPQDVENYILIIIIRNPYERLVSGFLDKYNEEGEFIHLWKDNKITFNMFVNKLLQKKYKIIHKHHFCPQTDEYFNKININKVKKLYIFDIKNIDYNLIEKLFNKNINDNIINYRGDHQGKKRSQKETFNNECYDLEMKIYYDYKINYNLFYNETIKKNIYNFYKKDFRFFEKYNFNYTI